MDRNLHIQLSEEGADAERLDTLTRYLRQELLGLDSAEVRPLPVESVRRLGVHVGA